jgi:hypothetical protein
MNTASVPILDCSDDESPLFSGLRTDREEREEYDSLIESLTTMSDDVSEVTEDELVDYCESPRNGQNYYVTNERYYGADSDSLGVVEVRKRKFISQMNMEEKKKLKKEYNARAKQALKERNKMSIHQATSALTTIYNYIHAIKVGLMKPEEIDIDRVQTNVENAVHMIELIKFN